jgi:hypothetical protein
LFVCLFVCFCFGISLHIRRCGTKLRTYIHSPSHPIVVRGSPFHIVLRQGHFGLAKHCGQALCVPVLSMKRARSPELDHADIEALLEEERQIEEELRDQAARAEQEPPEVEDFAMHMMPQDVLPLAPVDGYVELSMPGDRAQGQYYLFTVVASAGTYRQPAELGREGLWSVVLGAYQKSFPVHHPCHSGPKYGKVAQELHHNDPDPAARLPHLHAACAFPARHRWKTVERVCREEFNVKAGSFSQVLRAEDAHMQHVAVSSCRGSKSAVLSYVFRAGEAWKRHASTFFVENWRFQGSRAPGGIEPETCRF